MHRNLMEENHLDLQQPFLSVRRFLPAVPPSGIEKKKKDDNSFQKVPALPFYKSDLKSGPIRNPGTVPFVWEKTPGRPKDESQSQMENHTQFSIAPKLPPGRNANVKQDLSFIGSSESISDAPQESTALSASTNVSAADGDISYALDSRAREGSMEKHSSNDSEDGDEAYVDALDTLSRNESFFLNCSLSGLSGLDTFEGKASGTNPTDSRTRDFMMDRFLPAAKAIASETPQHASRKQPFVRDDARVTKMVVGRDKPPVTAYKPNVRDYALNYKVKESEDEDNDCDGPGNFSGKVCGLLPRFCLNTSLSVMNPVPGMRITTRGTSVRRQHSKLSTTGLCRDSQIESNAINQGQSGFSRKANGQLEDRNYKKCTSTRPTNHGNRHESGGLLLQRHSHGGDAFHNNQKLSRCPPNEKSEFSGSFQEAKKSVNGVEPAQGRTFQELLADPNTEVEFGFSDQVIEKTLYIDSVHKYKSPNSSSLEDNNALSESKVSKNPATFEEMKMISVTASSPQDGKHVNIDNRRTEFQLQLDSFVQSRSVQEIKIEAEISPKQGCDVIKDPISSTRKDMFDNWKTDFEAKQMPKSKGGDKSNGTLQLLPLPPPLPKSPSESWLGRTLPHISSQKLSSRSHLVSGAYGQQPSTTTNHTNWEPAYRTAKAYYGQIGLPQEMLTTIPET